MSFEFRKPVEIINGFLDFNIFLYSKEKSLSDEATLIASEFLIKKLALSKSRAEEINKSFFDLHKILIF